jgi:hypothetical protein
MGDLYYVCVQDLGNQPIYYALQITVKCNIFVTILPRARAMLRRIECFDRRLAFMLRVMPLVRGATIEAKGRDK